MTLEAKHEENAEYRALEDVITGLVQNPMDEVQRKLSEKIDGLAMTLKRVRRDIDELEDRFESKNASRSDRAELKSALLEEIENSGTELQLKLAELADAQRLLKQQQVTLANGVVQELSRVTGENATVNTENRRNDIAQVSSDIHRRLDKHERRQDALANALDSTSDQLQLMSARDEEHAAGFSRTQVRLLWITTVGVIGAWIAMALVAWHTVVG
jgi:tetrahydromethanopterin S-methyltransferase subunit B